MKNFYYYLTLAVFFLVFASGNALAQPGCNDLEITATQEDDVCGLGSLNLSVTPSGTGDVFIGIMLPQEEIY